MFEALVTVLGAGLSIWNHKLKTRYTDKLISLKKDWYEEYSKPDHIRSSAALDNLEFELKLLCLGFAAEATTKDSGIKP